MMRYVLPIVIEKDEAGYVAACPSLQGCYTQGDTYEEALDNIRDAIRLHSQDPFAMGETINATQTLSITTVEVAV